MKTLGIIGGIAPESTIAYYRQIVAAYREHVTDGSYPRIIINSIDLQEMIGYVARNELATLVDYLVANIDALARAGADFAIMSSNTPHIVFDDVARRSPLPMISIIEVTRAEASSRGFRRLGLFGSRFTMQGRAYPNVFAKSGIEIVPPEPADLDFVHDKYFAELVNGVFLPETRDALLAIAERMDIEALILGGTELPLILRDGMAKVPFLDTTAIHVKAAVARMLEN